MAILAFLLNTTVSLFVNKQC